MNYYKKESRDEKRSQFTDDVVAEADDVVIDHAEVRLNSNWNLRFCIEGPEGLRSEVDL